MLVWASSLWTSLLQLLLLCPIEVRKFCFYIHLKVFFSLIFFIDHWLFRSMLFKSLGLVNEISSHMVWVPFNLLCPKASKFVHGHLSDILSSYCSSPCHERDFIITVSPSANPSIYGPYVSCMEAVQSALNCSSKGTVLFRYLFGVSMGGGKFKVSLSWTHSFNPSLFQYIIFYNIIFCY